MSYLFSTTLIHVMDYTYFKMFGFLGVLWFGLLCFHEFVNSYDFAFLLYVPYLFFVVVCLFVFFGCKGIFFP